MTAVGVETGPSVFAGNPIDDVNAQSERRRGRTRNCGIVVTTNGNGDLVEYRPTAATPAGGDERVAAAL